MKMPLVTVNVPAEKQRLMKHVNAAAIQKIVAAANPASRADPWVCSTD